MGTNIDGTKKTNDRSQVLARRRTDMKWNRYAKDGIQEHVPIGLTPCGHVCGCGLKRRPRQQDPPTRPEAVVDDACIELTGLLGALPSLHTSQTTRNRVESATSRSRRRPATFSTTSGGRPAQSHLFTRGPATMGTANTKIDHETSICKRLTTHVHREEIDDRSGVLSQTNETDRIA